MHRSCGKYFFDWLFIFPLQMGVVGAAVASGLGQICSVLVLLTHFIRKKGDLRIKAFKIDISLVRKITKRGVPEAFTQLATPVTALCYNLMLASLIGDIGVSTFSVLSYISSLANAILSGVAQGLQPLWGQCYVRKDTDEMNWYFRSGMVISRGVVLKALAIFCVPLILGTDAIWIAPFAAEIIALIIAVVLSKINKLVYR